MIVRENISFQRGLDPKKALDVGVKRRGLKEYFENSLGEKMREYIPGGHKLSNEDIIGFLPIDHPSNQYSQKTPTFDKIFISVSREYLLITSLLSEFNKKVIKWFADNGYEIISFKYKTVFDAFEIEFKEK